MKNVVKIFIFFLFLGISFLFSIQGYFSLCYEKEVLSSTKKTYDFAIVPGAKIEDQEPSPFLKERLDKAILLYKGKQVKKIILSGGYNSTYKKHETDVMKAYLQKRGIPLEDLIIDRAGFSTYDTIARYQEKFPQKRAIFITQKAYANRALYIARKKDALIDVMDCSTGEYNLSLKAYIRELLAPVKAILEVHMEKKPEYTITEKDFENSK